MVLRRALSGTFVIAAIAAAMWLQQLVLTRDLDGERRQLRRQLILHPGDRSLVVGGARPRFDVTMNRCI